VTPLQQSCFQWGARRTIAAQHKNLLGCPPGTEEQLADILIVHDELLASVRGLTRSTEMSWTSLCGACAASFGDDVIETVRSVGYCYPAAA
jgi:hypothetical protein